MLSTVLTVDSPRPEPATLTLVSGGDRDDGAIYRVEGCSFNIHAEAQWIVQLYVRLTNHNEINDYGHHWEADLLAVSAAFAGDHSIIDAVNSSWGTVEIMSIKDDKRFLAALDECLIWYGVFAPLLSKTSKRVNGPLRGAASEAKAIAMMAGVFLDRQVNAVGSTGWDFMAGRLGAGFHHDKPKKLEGGTASERELIDRVNRLIPDRYLDEEG